MIERFFDRRLGHLFPRPGAKRSARSRQCDAFNAAMAIPGERLENTGMLAVNWQQLTIMAGSMGHEDIAGNGEQIQEDGQNRQAETA